VAHFPVTLVDEYQNTMDPDHGTHCFEALMWSKGCIFYDVYKRDASFRTECPRSVEEDGKWQWTKCGADRLRSSQHGALRNLTQKREGGAERGNVLPQQPRRIRPPTLPCLDTFALRKQPPNRTQPRKNSHALSKHQLPAGRVERRLQSTPQDGRHIGAELQSCVLGLRSATIYATHLRFFGLDRRYT
jgi:hypothetical protein